MAYKLKLLTEAKIHDVFHVSQLKPFHGALPQVLRIPQWLQGLQVLSKLPEAILGRRFVKVNNAAQTQFLVKWIGLPMEEAQRVIAADFQLSFPSSPI